MAKAFTTRKARKIEPAEGKALSRAKMGVGRPTPPPGDVEAQERTGNYYICPWCSAFNWVLRDEKGREWSCCWHCGMGCTRPP